MSLIDSTFMESYRQNVMITGGDGDLEGIFEGATPISFEEAISSIYEIQYSVEAMAIMNENAFMMESADVAVLNEGVIGNFISAAVDKIKELAQKVRDFVVAVIKKVQEFFRELYAKATPIDKCMQMYGKKPIEPSDITVAIANGLKIPGSLKLVNGSVDVKAISNAVIDPKNTNIQKALIILGTPAKLQTAMGQLNELQDEIDKMPENNTKYNAQNNLNKAANQLKYATLDALKPKKLKEYTETLKEAIVDLKEIDKENFTWVGQLLSDNDTYTKKTLLNGSDGKGGILVYAGEGGDKTKDVKSISPDKWKATADIALNGQSKMREYEADIRKKAKKEIKTIEDWASEIKKQMSQLTKDRAAQGKSLNTSFTAEVNSCISAVVAATTYLANRHVMILQRVYTPTMRKQHNAAITTYIWITSHVRSAKRKEERKLK